MAKRKSHRPSSRSRRAGRRPRRPKVAAKTRRLTGAKPLAVPKDSPQKRFQENLEDRLSGLPQGVEVAKQYSSARLLGRSLSPSSETAMTPVTAGGSNWIELGPTAIPEGQTYGGARVIVTGRVTEVVQHPTDPLTLYVGTARGGVWKSSDGGTTWEPRSDHEESLAIGALAMAPSNPQVLYAGTGEGDIYYYRLLSALGSVNAEANGAGILKSLDGGLTWTRQGAATFTGACFYRMAVHPTNPNVAMGASNRGLFRTVDGGTTWAALASGLPALIGSVIACCDIVFDPVAPDTAYCAFWADGVYRTTTATATTPSWTKVAGGFPSTNLSRIALAVSPTAPANVYALVANSADGLRGLYASSDGGSTWSAVGAASGVVSVYGAFTLNVAVDISTPDIVYLSGVELYKAVRTTGTWVVTNVGASIHPDNHAFASHPTDHLTIYAGNDGGIYKSTDGGATWDDRINEGLSITQFEFIGQHPTSDAMVIGGTQDNGTEMFRNHPAFYHSADGDGGAAGVDSSDPRKVIHTYYGVSPERSTEGGRLGSYAGISAGLAGSGLFYPPWTYDDSNPQRVAFGTTLVNLDDAQGTGGWPTKVTLPGITQRVSALSYPNDSLIYAGTSNGQVFRLVRSGSTWAATAIHAAPLPARWIWDIAPVPGDPNTVVVVMSGFGTAHVWRGVMTMGGTFTWTDVSGTAPNRLADVPVNSLNIDPLNPAHYYIGSDVGVFRTLDGGANWEQFSNGLPNTAVYDLRLHASTRLLRAATHGRGLWERRLDIAALPNVELFVRDHMMSTGRIVPTPSPVPAPYQDPLQHVAVGDNLWWWQSVDVKIDAPAVGTHTYQLPVAEVDYLAMETRLEHRNPQRGVLNRVYVQVHNRGVQVAANVTVKVLYADAGPGLPPLPTDFWTAFPGDGTTTVWHPLGSAKVIPLLSPKRPEVLEWDWVPPAGAAVHSCLLMVVDSPDDPIAPASKVLDIATLVTSERRVGLKNLHVIDALPGPVWFDLRILTHRGNRDELLVDRLPPGWNVGLLLPAEIAGKVETKGLKRRRLTKAEVASLERHVGKGAMPKTLKGYLEISTPTRGASLGRLPAMAKGFRLFLLGRRTAEAAEASLTILQRSGGQVIGGNTFVLRRATKA